MLVVALLIAWVLVAFVTVCFCVAARRGDEGERLRGRRETARPHLPTRLSA